MPDFGRFGPLVGVIDEGTTFARFLIFTVNTCEMLTYHQNAVKRLYLSDDRIEQDPMHILKAVLDCIEKTIDNMIKLDIDPTDIVTIGITNQSETIIVWDANTGLPLYNAIVWLDTRASSIAESLAVKCGPGGAREMRSISGIPPLRCTFASRLRWLIDNIPAVNTAISDNTCRAGTVDSWLIWNLTGGTGGGSHLTDVTNASRTGLMSLSTLTWHAGLGKHFGVPLAILPKIKPCNEIFGQVIQEYPLPGVYISGVMAHQQAALFGQGCFKYGDTLAAYGTGCFVLFNTGHSIIIPENDLITTVAYKSHTDQPVYALEGFAGMLGESFHWLKELGISVDLKAVLSTRSDKQGNVCFMPPLAGLAAPRRSTKAKGFIYGICEDTTQLHISQASVDAVCQVTRTALRQLTSVTKSSLRRLIVGGNIAEYSAFLQSLADACRIPLIHPLVCSSVALGAASMAGSARGIRIWPRYPPMPPSDIFRPLISEEASDLNYERWTKCLEKSMTCCDSDEVSQPSICPNQSFTLGLFMMGSCALLLLANRNWI